MVNKITIIGVGLIGGSLAKALKVNNFAKEITGFGRNKNNLQLAQDLAIIDNWSTNIKDAINNSDIIVLATPVGIFAKILQQIKPYLKNQIITDVGSTKQSVIDDVCNILGNSARFVPAHPIAGKEKSGCENADKNLFIGKKVIITGGGDKELIKKMWQTTGAIVEEMNAKKHDDIFALTSHLPHILAFGFVNYMSSQKGSENWTGGGFKDFTRIASSDSKMWADICENNKDEILKHLENYQQELNILQNLLRNNNSDAYKSYFLSAKKHRDEWINKSLFNPNTTLKK